MKALIIAGAGMSVESGLKTYRGEEGLYLGIDPYDLITERAFFEKPEIAWGFYASRINEYKDAEPHEGYYLLREMFDDIFVLTTNVDGLFQKAGFDKVIEVHGCIFKTQNSARDIFDVPLNLEVIGGKCVNIPENNGELLRPNVLMFDDVNWAYKPYQCDAVEDWITTDTYVIEIGCGTEVPRGRNMTRKYGEGMTVRSPIRINPDRAPPQYSYPSKVMQVKMGAIDGIKYLLEADLDNMTRTDPYMILSREEMIEDLFGSTSIGDETDSDIIWAYKQKHDRPCVYEEGEFAVWR